MTTEEIEKAANEFAEKHGFRVPYDGSNEFYDKVDVRASKDGFKAGVEFANKHWQEKTRWKSLETEPPKFEGKKYQILIRHSPITHDVACIVSSRSVEFCIAKGYKYWKEIE